MKKILLALILILIQLLLLAKNDIKTHYTKKRGYFRHDTTNIIQVSPEMITRVINSREDEPDYPKDVYIFPSNEQMRELSIKQRVDSYNLPENVLQKTSTEGLIETCLKYPLIDLLPAQTSAGSSFMTYMNNFNGFSELLIRSDYIQKMFAVFEKSTYRSYTSLKFIHKKTAITLLFSHAEIIKSLTHDERIKVIQITLEEVNRTEPKDYLIANILLFEEYQPFLDLMSANKNVEHFVKGKSPRFFSPKLISSLGLSFIESSKGSIK